MQDLTAAQRVVLAVYADLAPLGPQGAGPAAGHIAVIMHRLPTPELRSAAHEMPDLETFHALCRELRGRGLLEGQGHTTYPLYRITDAGREALAGDLAT